MELSVIEQVVGRGESERLEFARSTGQLDRAGETLCAFLNAEGGRLIVGVTAEGTIVGQEVTDETRREIAAMLDRLEPPFPVGLQYVDLPDSDRQVIVLDVRLDGEARPFTFGGRAYQRAGTTTSTMPPERSETLFLERAHARRRWENRLTVLVGLQDLDREEILRTREAAISARRLPAETSTDLGDVLDRLGLRRNGVLTQAAQVLYGTRFLPDHPQCRLHLKRHRGTNTRSAIVKERQKHLHAFAIVREAMAWLESALSQAHQPHPGESVRGDRLPVPAGALREALVNAVMHRDYEDPHSRVTVAVLDDRIEVRSVGRPPRGVTAQSLSGEHPSVLRNPLIAGAFHRTGAVEDWGRGTNRVIEECRRHGAEPPAFNERAGRVIVTFPAAIGPPLQATPDAVPPGTSRVINVLKAARRPSSRACLQEAAGLSDEKHFLYTYLGPLLAAGLLEMTIPDRPTSSRQKYRTTEAGESYLAAEP